MKFTRTSILESGSFDNRSFNVSLGPNRASALIRLVSEDADSASDSLELLLSFETIDRFSLFLGLSLNGDVLDFFPFGLIPG